MTNIDAQALAKTLGRHTRVAIPFRWHLGGDPVDLEAGGYSARVWVRDPSGQTIGGPFDATVSGDTATYVLSETDLADASPTESDHVQLVCVAENGTNTLVSDALEVLVGEWGGAETYTPIGT